jgi:class 3 adenylate cyclase/HAMP domain-containing protein
VRSPLTRKVILVIVVVLIIGFGASTIFTIQRESAALVEQHKSGARRLMGALIAGIESAMLQERPDVTRAMIQEIRGSSPVEGLDIYRRNGVEAFSDLETLEEVERNAGLSKEVFANIQKMRRPPGAALTGPAFARAVQSLTPHEELETRDGVALFTLLQPIPNREKCQGCHGSDHQVRAVVRIATSMQPVFAEVRQQRNRQILIGVLTILAAAGVLTLAMRKVVIRPIQELVSVVRRIGDGDFEARAAANSRDEIGGLAVAFNNMTDRLARARAELAAKNSELEGALQSLQESRRRLELLEQLKGELSKFVPEAVKELLERNPDAIELEKRTVEVSVLFLDIAGYTRLSETQDPRRLDRLVQTYFSSFLEIIHAQRGDVNETAGDGLMVIFQAAEHSLGATRAAVAIRQRTAALNEEYGALLAPIQLHMGINTGEALVGATKLGGPSGQRWTFTATGSTTNIAARIAASAGAGDIVVGPLTAERIRAHFVLENLGDKTFKNVSIPLRVYRVIPPGVYETVT